MLDKLRDEMEKAGIHELGLMSNPNFSYFLIAIFFIAYLVTGFWVFGLLVGMAIVWVVLLEFVLGAKAHGIVNELKETLIALVLALLVWFGSGFLLQTSSPLNAIVSCSMLPHLDRGDMVILNGDRVQAPQAGIPALPDLTNAQVYQNGKLIGTVKGSIYSYCSQMGRDSSPLCQSFITFPDEYTEVHGPLTFGYGTCQVIFPKTGQLQSAPCVLWLQVNGTKYYTNLSDDVVVYQPEPDEYYARVGDIIHRAYIRLKADDTGTVYFLTKGDNNPIFDIQAYDENTDSANRPVELTRSKGRVMFDIPYLGYLKLFISPNAILTPNGCDSYYTNVTS